MLLNALFYPHSIAAYDTAWNWTLLMFVIATSHEREALVKHNYYISLHVIQLIIV